MSSGVQKSKSVGLVSLFLLSLFVAMITTVPAVTAVNETSSGTITGTETWTGVMNLDGDLVVAGGAKLIINAGQQSTYQRTRTSEFKAQYVQETLHVGHHKRAQDHLFVSFGVHLQTTLPKLEGVT